MVPDVDLLTNNVLCASHAFNAINDGYDDRRVIKEKGKGGSGYSKNLVDIGSEGGAKISNNL